MLRSTACLLAVALAVCISSQARATVSIPYVIVTDTTLVDAFAPLADWHANAGLNAATRTLQSIRVQYPVARDDAERIRLFLRDAYASWGARFVLLGGDEPLIPMRRAFDRLSYYSPTSADVLLPTDQYYACLAGDWDADGDGIWGELAYPSLGETGDDVSHVPDLAVGRAPVTAFDDAQRFVTRTLEVLDGSGNTGAVNTVLAATASGYPPQYYLDWAFYAQNLLPTLNAIPGASVTRYYRNASAWPGSQQETAAAVLAALNGNPALAVLLGSGSAGQFEAGGFGQLILSTDFAALQNSSLMVAYFLSAMTTQPGPGSVGSALVRAAQGGAVAVIGTSDTQFVTPATYFMNSFFDLVVHQHVATLGEALQQAIANFPYSNPPNDIERLTTQGSILFGDPALPAPWTVSFATPVELSFVDAQVSDDSVAIRWFSAAGPGLTASVERRTEATGWSAIGNVTADGTGRLVYEDRAVLPGARYGYRLAVTDPTGTRYLGEAWVDLPATRLALLGASPNPATTRLWVRFTLPDDRPASLELVDVSGRALRRIDVGSLGAGAHGVDLAAGHAPEPGVYLVRLIQGGRSLTRRACVVR